MLTRTNENDANNKSTKVDNPISTQKPQWYTDLRKVYDYELVNDHTIQDFSNVISFTHGAIYVEISSGLTPLFLPGEMTAIDKAHKKWLEETNE